MKKNYISLIACFLISLSAFAQEAATPEFKPSGKFDGRIFTNFATSVEGVDPAASAFELKRAYLGYTYQLSSEFSARMLLDVGDDSKVAGMNRYGYFRNAALFYKKDKLTVGFGLQETNNLKYNDQIWGNRFVEKTFQDLYGFTHTADMGLTVRYNMDIIELDAAIYNGEGYKSVQKDNVYRGIAGITALLMDKKLTLRLSDEYVHTTFAMHSTSFLIGYQEENKYTISAEYDVQTNFKLSEGIDRSGFSVLGSVNATPKLSVFARFDQVEAAFDDDILKTGWKFNEDGQRIIAGVKYSILKNLQSAVNIQRFQPDVDDSDAWMYAYVNFDIKF